MDGWTALVVGLCGSIKKGWWRQTAHYFNLQKEI